MTAAGEWVARVGRINPVNPIDALVAVVILVLIPASFGAHLLSRTRQPKLASIEPATLYQGSNLRIGVYGTNLQPFMRIGFSFNQGRSFLIESPTHAQAELPDLGPGTYDVQLFDDMQEIARLPKALTILPPGPTVKLDVDGSFEGLDAALVAHIKPGVRFPPGGAATVAEVLSVGGVAPARLRLRTGDRTVAVPMPGQSELSATLRVSCHVATNEDGSLQCMVTGPQQASIVAPDSNLMLAGPEGWMMFQISDVHAPSTVATNVPANK